MVDLTADMTHLTLETPESSLFSIVQTLLREMNSQSASQEEKFRWSLPERLESDPSCSVSLIQVLKKNLKTVSKIGKTLSYMHLVPVLHTLNYVLIQSGAMIPTSFYETVSECLMKLLVLPSPYSAVVISTLRSIKMEMITPGSLYQRRVIAEQNLKNEHFTLREKVFVLADQAVFSVQLEATVRAYLDISSFGRRTPTMEKNVLLHVLQRGLGSTCQSSRLARALEALQDDRVEKYFQDVVQAVEQSVKHGAGGRANYLNRLEIIYRDITTASQDEKSPVDHSSVCYAAMPSPEINFQSWRYTEELWDLLEDFAMKNKRDSFGSEDSGKERHQAGSGFEDQTLKWDSVSTFKRRNAVKNMKQADKLTLMREKIEAFPGSSPVITENERSHIAKVVVMGDDRVLGRLAKAYHSIRERESKRLVLTKKLNLQFYYIAVTEAKPSLSPLDSPCEDTSRLTLASTLGRVDPWYNSNINSLRTAILKLNEMHSNHRKSSQLQQNFFLLDSLCYYLRCGMQPVNLPIYSVKMTVCDPSFVVEEVFVSHLEAHIPEFRHIKEMSSSVFQKEHSSSKKRSTVFGLFISVSYTKISLSKREVVMGEPPMTVGVEITSEPTAGTSGEGYLTVMFDSLNPANNTEIQTQNISIRTLERRTLSVCLDKDPHRTYTNVQRIEVSLCLDPGCSIRPRSSINGERELQLSKNSVERLSLPINTFSGVTL